MGSLPGIRDHLMIRSNRRYLLMSPDGTEIEVPPELFRAINDFMVGRKDAGSMVVHFRNGGVAGLETVIKKKYK
ncbi:MAG TPA: hypothetical protein VKH81_22175 [Candidatus Angelobacter sp.]|nr:hypothetical protein [Candidatus Angelobacter sp.]